MTPLVIDGRPKLGRFAEPFSRTNLIEAQPFSFPAPRWLRSLRLKEWQAVQAIDDRFVVCVSLFNAKALALAQVRVHDRDTGAHWVAERRLAGFTLRVPDTLLDSHYAYRGRGMRIEFLNRMKDGQVSVHFELGGTKEYPAMSGELIADYAGATPLVVSIPFPSGGSMYSHKGPARLSGSLSIGGTRHTFDPAVATLLMDDHKGYYPRTMKWDWLTGACAGKAIAFNLTVNQSADPQRYNENAFWIDGKIHALPPVQFERQDEWQITDAAGYVDLRFTPQAETRLTIPGGALLDVDYWSPIGHVQGRLSAEDGTTVEVDDALAMAEKLRIRF